MGAVKVTLRKREYASGKVSLYLDFYPAIRNPRTMQMTRREYLGIYIMKSPRTAADRRVNAAKLKQAEAIRAQREISLINEQYGFLDKGKGMMNVLDYFYSILPGHDKKWRIVYEHFNIFVKGQCNFDELTVDFCNKFREYLGTTTRIKSDHLKLSQNSAAGYWSTFRAFLAIAFKEGYLKENVNDYLDKIETQETKREYLTQEELQKIADSHCDYPVLKSASLFSCLTGLRLSDILPKFFVDGEIVIKNRLITQEVQEAREAKLTVDKIIAHLHEKGDKKAIVDFEPDWAQDTVDRLLFPENYKNPESDEPFFDNKIEDFLKFKKISYQRHKSYCCIFDIVKRFELYAGKPINMDKATGDTLVSLEKFLRKNTPSLNQRKTNIASS